MKQYVTVPTHDAGHCLDVVIARDQEPCVVEDLHVHDTGVSDHCAVIFTVSGSPPPPITKTVRARAFRECNMSELKDDLAAADIDLSSVSAAVESYNLTMQPLMDKHAPEVQKTVTIRPNTRWYKGYIRRQKVIKRRLERKFVKSGLDDDKKAYRKQCDYISFLIDEAKTKFFCNKICESKSNKKQLFDTAKELLHWKSEPKYPLDIPSDRLPFDFATYFSDKIVKINQQIKSDSVQLLASEFEEYVHAESELLSFQATDAEEIERIIASMSSASRNPSLIKACRAEIALTHARIVNLSLEGAEVPDSLKNACIRPLLKKATLDPNSFKNFRPVSNIPFLSKVIEKVVADRLTRYLEDNYLFEPLQSAYKKFHSTETALLRVHNDITRSLEKRNVVVLLLLDLSAAFDTVCHDRLLHRLHSRFGISGKAYDWIKSYLCNRSQFVTIAGISSSPTELKTQGSVLGPILFTLYVAPLGDITRRYGMGSHFYADDTQLFLSCKPAEISHSLENLESCVTDIKNWMAVNFLKLNDDKTEILLLGSKHSLSNVPSISVKVGELEITSQSFVKNLGAYFDSTLSMENFVAQKCKTAAYYLRCISHIRKYLDSDSTKTLVHALVTSRLDYANSLLLGSNKMYLSKLQMVQNSAARLIMRVDRRSHITPVLKTLHWLPIEHRITYKIIVLCFNCIYGNAPGYLQDLIVVKKNDRNLRSSQSILLNVPFTRSSVYSRKCFYFTAPKLWNCLPAEIRNCDNLEMFKSLLKTHLFRIAYSC